MKISKLVGVVCGATFLLGTRAALADISIGDSGATVNFTGFTAAGFQPTAAPGGLSSNDWAVSGFSDGDLNFGGTNNNADYTRGTTFPGASAGGIYAPTSGSEFLAIRLSDADFSPGVITARFKNTGTHKYIKLNVSYDLLVYNDNDRSSSIVFSWSTDNITYNTPGGALSVNTTAAKDASPAWVRTGKSTTLTTNIIVGANLYLRWTSDDVPGGSGSRDAFGLDNIAIEVPEVCGDGENTGNPEECDDGNTSNADSCLNTCEIASCGDDFVRTEGANPEQCDGTVCCSNNCTKLTGSPCPGGTCNNGSCVPTAGTGGTTGGGGEGGDTGVAGEGGDTGMGGAGEAGTAAGNGGRAGRGGRGGQGGNAGGGAPGAGTSGAPAAGTAGAPAAGTAGTGGTAGGSAGTGTAAGSGGKGGTAGTSTTGGKGGTSNGGSGTKPPPSSDSDDDSGCGCSVPRSSNHGTLALVFAGALVAFMRRRRR